MHAVIIDPKAPMPDNYAVRFGHFNFKWNQIESMIEEAIWLIAGTPPLVGRIFTNKLTVRYRTDLLSELVQVVDVPDQARIIWKGVKRDVDKLAKKRNEMVHSRWAHLEGQGFLLSTKFADAKVGLVTGTRKIDLDDILNYINQADKIIQSLREMISVFEKRASASRGE